MNYKILTFGFLFLFVQCMAPVSVEAQAVVATTNIDEVQIVKQDSNEITVSFTLSNKTGVQPDLHYVFELYDSAGGLVDTHIYEDTFSLRENETHDDFLTYSVPTDLHGVYALAFSVRNQKGIPLAFTEVSNSLTLNAVASSSQKNVSTTDESNAYGTESDLGRDLPVGAEEVSNHINLAYQTDGSSVDIINIILDKDYYSNGDTAKISVFNVLNTTSSQNSENGDGSTVSSSPEISVFMTSGSSDIECTASAPEPAMNGSQIIEMQVTADCPNPTLKVVIMDNGIELVSRIISVDSTSAPITQNRLTFIQKIMVLASLLIIVIVPLLLKVGNRRSSEYLRATDIIDTENNATSVGSRKPPLFFLFLLSVSLFVPIDRAHADMYMSGDYAYTYNVTSGNSLSVYVSASNVLGGSLPSFSGTAVILNNSDRSPVGSILDLTPSPRYPNTLVGSFSTPSAGDYIMYFTINMGGNSVTFERAFSISNGNNNGNNLPDLLSRYFNAPTSIMVQELFSLSAQVKNSSDTDVDTPFSDEFSYVDGNSVKHSLAILQNTSLDNWEDLTDRTSSGGVSISVPGTYTFSHCVDSLGQISESYELNNCSTKAIVVTQPAPPVITSFDVTRDFIRPNESTALYWQASNTNGCTLRTSTPSSWDGQVPKQHNGLTVGPLSGTPSTYTFTLTCTSPVGFASVSKSVSVRVALIANPPIRDACKGLDIALVLDTSGSIDSTESRQFVTGLKKFIESINTDSVFSLTNFARNAQVIKLFSQSKEQMLNYFNSYTYGLCNVRSYLGCTTNWEQGLIVGNSTFDPRPDRQNIILFATDGQPNTKKTNPPVSTTEADALSAAITVGNHIKDSGTAIYVLAVSENAARAADKQRLANNLAAVSGPEAVVSTTFDNVGNALTDLSTSLMCGGEFQCANPVDHATLLSPDEATGLTASASWTYSEIDTDNKCEFICDSDYSWDAASKACRLGSSGHLFVDGNSYTKIDDGQSVVLTWDTSNIVDASSCRVVNITDGRTISSGQANNFAGISSGPLSGENRYTFVLQCDGKLLDSAVVEIQPPSGPIILTASPRIVSANSRAKLTWDTGGYNESSCTLKGNDGTNIMVVDPLPSGDTTGDTLTRPIFGLTTYTLQCGTQNVTAVIEVIPSAWEQ